MEKKWNLSEDGTLTIQGDFHDVPWEDMWEDIREAVILPGTTVVPDYAFYNCTGLTSITIPNSVTSIGEYAFCGCSSLTSVVIPDSVTSIGECAFCGCSSLTSVVIPDGVTSIGDWAFEGCSSLTNIVLPDGVTRIGARAFEGCSSLTSITIPEGVTSIGDNAFRNCTRLTSITIPNSVTRIGEGMLDGCTSLWSHGWQGGLALEQMIQKSGLRPLKFMLVSVTRSELEICESIYATKKEAYNAMIEDILLSTSFNSLEEIIDEANAGNCGLSDDSAWAETIQNGTGQWKIIAIPQ